MNRPNKASSTRTLHDGRLSRSDATVCVCSSIASRSARNRPCRALFDVNSQYLQTLSRDTNFQMIDRGATAVARGSASVSVRAPRGCAMREKPTRRLVIV